MSDGWELDELAGDLVRLRAPKLADLDAFDAFRDSDGERRWGQTELPRSPELSRAWLEELVNRKREDDTAFLVVESSEGEVLLRFYFGELRYQRCEAVIYGFNEPSLAFHRKLGFEVEGTRRRALYTQGRYHDKVMVGMLREEFEVAHGF